MGTVGKNVGENLSCALDENLLRRADAVMEEDEVA